MRFFVQGISSKLMKSLMVNIGSSFLFCGPGRFVATVDFGKISCFAGGIQLGIAVAFGRLGQGSFGIVVALGGFTVLRAFFGGRSYRFLLYPFGL